MQAQPTFPMYADQRSERETQLQRLLTVYVITGLVFMLLPGTFLGVWNLISISGRHSVASLTPSWIQAHGHAQIFGWIGTFILGIGYYSLSKMGKIARFAVSRGWLTWCFWTAGVVLRWVANVAGSRAPGHGLHCLPSFGSPPLSAPEPARVTVAEAAMSPTPFLHPRSNDVNRTQSDGLGIVMPRGLHALSRR